MLKKILLALCAFVMSTGLAFAQVDVNKGDQAALDGIKGIGPAMSKRILDERKKGDFKDWTDFETRVKGVGDKSANKLSDAGLTVNGQPRSKSLVTGKGEAKPFPKKMKDQDAKADKPAATKG
ncbi:ComEA family DNA-binding protein [Herbaspirillum rhizosphaerae]|uniref:ComEA family DNA-binding protein n=1 Tax=Herbaspirillum rhizosphaerae TaxID=346179 RepID=UPI00067D2A1D|nr:helix-hairpin-helix domain-containing protein [Herbaspirillum rhizosphaerae]